jgi:hypothetical protein
MTGERISAETVTQTWQRMAQTPLHEAPRFVDQLRKEQPVICGYLLSLDSPPFIQHEGGIIFYLGVVVWQIMKQSKRQLCKVTRRGLERAEKVNYDFLERITSDTEADFVSATQSLLERYPEPEVLRFIVEAIMEEEEDRDPEDPPLREECRGLAFVHLKTVLDALGDSLGPQQR